MKVIVIILFLFLLGGCFQDDSYSLQGYVEGEYTQLASSLEGRLRNLYVSRGQTVVSGQPLFALDPEPEASQLTKALSNLASEKSKLQDYMSGQRSTVLAGIIAQKEQAQADLELAQNNFNRTSQLFQKGIVSRSNYDDALAKLKLNQQKVNQFEQNIQEAELGERQYRILQQTGLVKAAEAEVAEARWRVAQKSIVAPEAGLIYNTFFNEGELVTPNQPVVSLLAPRYVYIVFYIPEPLRSSLKINERVYFDCDGCGRRYEAFINYISPEAEYTPPVIYSRDSRQKLVYRIQAKLPLEVSKKVNPGQPVDILIPSIHKNKHYLFGNFLWNQT